MMLISIYHMIRDNKDFEPSDFQELMNPKPKKSKEQTIEGAIKLLSENGYSVTPLTESFRNQVLPPPIAA